MVEIVIELFGYLVLSKQLQLQNEISADLPMILADENRMLQILNNLLGNAVKLRIRV